jgi:hypothetical protein
VFIQSPSETFHAKTVLRSNSFDMDDSSLKINGMDYERF